MDDDLDMGGVDGGFDFSTDENYQWTEICSPTIHDDQPEFPHNLGSLNVYDPATISMDCQIEEGAQAFIFEALFYLPFSFKPLPVVVKRFKPLEGVSLGQFPP